MVQSDKKDYRFGKNAKDRTVDAQEAILQVLNVGKKNFGELEAQTRLSRTALAANLKKMYKEGIIDRETDPQDFRFTHYSLTDKGWNQYFIEFITEMLAMANDFVNSNQKQLGKGTIVTPLTSDEQLVLAKCFQSTISATTPEKNHPFFFEPLMEFLTNVKKVVSNQDVDIEALEGLCDISFNFELKRKNLINMYKEQKTRGTPM